MEKEKFPDPKDGSIFFEDKKAYACLAFHPVVDGHTLIVWKEEVEDIGDLNKKDFAHLMKVVKAIREILLRAYCTDKVYIAYTDEIRHVHFHLFPRKKGGIEGFELISCPHRELGAKDLSIIPTLQALVKNAKVK